MNVFATIDDFATKLSLSLYRAPPYPAGGSRTIPLKLKWGKKSGRYDLSQEVYVLSVNLGERLIIQCTLTTESSARECVEFIRQKCELNQIAMFGLRFQMRTADPDQRMMRWVELDKPLRKQLEKWACKPRQVQLAILYHTPNAFTLTDQMARSYYFLLMKLDVVEDRVTVEAEKVINMAAYSLQVEYGDFDENVHTIDFMQTIPLLPKSMFSSANVIESHLNRVQQVYEKLRGMKPEHAALLYIVDAMQCEGYGEEYFKGKDEDSSEVKVGYSPKGIIVRGSYGAPITNVWDEIKEITAHKRHLHIKMNDGRMVEFIMVDNEMARYVAMVFNWQFHYATHEAIELEKANKNINDLQGTIKTFANHHVSNTELNSTRVNMSQTDMHMINYENRALSSSHLSELPRKPNSLSLSNINAVDRKPPLSSVSFRHPMTVAISSPERARAATSSCFPLPSQSSPMREMTPPVNVLNGSQPHSLSSQPHGSQSVLGRPQMGSLHGSAAHLIQSQTQMSNGIGSTHHLQSQHGSQNPMGSQAGNGSMLHFGSTHQLGLEGIGNIQMIQPPPPQQIPLWHPNMTDDKNASYKALFPYAVEIGGGQTSQQRRPSEALANVNGVMPKKIMGSSPEMRLLGTQNGDTEFAVQTILERMTLDVQSASTSRRDGNTFQSTPNLMSLHTNNNQNIVLVNMQQKTAQNGSIPSEPPVYPTVPHPKPLLSSTPSSASRNQVNSQPSEKGSTTASASSLSMRLYADETNSPARHTLLNGVVQRDGEMLGEGKEQMSTMIDSKLHCSMNAMRAEFVRIPNKRLSAGTSTSIKPENLFRNRTRSIVPYEDNRVMLRPHKSNPTGYINASNVEVLVGGKKLLYILTQAPLRETVDDFWATVWESGCQVIVMLSEAKLDSTNDSPIYWPSNPSSKVETRQLTVKFKSTSTTRNEVTTVLELKNKSCSGRRTIYHLRYIGWQTDGTPDEHSLLAFMDSVASVRRHVDNEKERRSSVGEFAHRVSDSKRSDGSIRNLHDVSNRIRSTSIDALSWKKRLNSVSTTASPHSPTLSLDSGDSGAPPSPTLCAPSPLLIHCHSGSHESGVYLLAEILIFCIEHNLSADLPTLLGKLRAQRMSLVKTVEQYRFVYSLLATYLQQSRLI